MILSRVFIEKVKYQPDPEEDGAIPKAKKLDFSIELRRKEVRQQEFNSQLRRQRHDGFLALNYYFFCTFKSSFLKNCIFFILKLMSQNLDKSQKSNAIQKVVNL